MFDFLKEPDEEQGGYTDKITVELGKRGKKNTLNYFAVAFGNSLDLQYEVSEEGGNVASLQVTLESGDAFVVNSLVKSLSYRVRQTTDRRCQQLILRPGCLLL